MTQELYGIMAVAISAIVAVITFAKNPIRSLCVSIYRRRYGIKAEPGLYVFAPDEHPVYKDLESGKTIPYKLHGLKVDIIGKAVDPYEVIGVSFRIKGVDLSNTFMEGWSAATPDDKAIVGKYVKNAYFDIAMRLEHKKQLVGNKNDLAGLRLERKKKVRFFMPIPFPGVNYALALPDSLAIVAHTTEGDKLLCGGRSVYTLVQQGFASWKTEPCDPGYPWQMVVHTIREKFPANTKMVNTYNDKPVSFR